MKNIHLIRTSDYKNAKVFQYGIKNGKLFSFYKAMTEPKHIHITSDEVITKVDYVLHIGNRFIFKYTSGENEFWKKIILTTDPKLIADGVQAIPDEFLEWLVKNPSCEEVEVKKECCGQCDERLCEIKDLQQEETRYNTFYKIIIPKEEPKQETLEESNQTTAIRFLEWYRLRKVIYQFHCYHIPDISDKNWKTTVFLGENSYLNSQQLFEIFKKE